MGFKNLRQITVLCQTNNNRSARSAVESAIVSVLYFAGVWAEYARLFDNKLGLHYFRQPSADMNAYLAKAHKESIVVGALNASTLLYSVRDDSSRSTEERYDVTVTKEALHWGSSSNRRVGGVGLVNAGAVISYNSIASLLEPKKGEDVKSVIERHSRFYLLHKTTAMHELGHIFGLWPYSGPTNATDEDLKKTHCQNECVMQWTITEDLANKIKGSPFCPTCLTELKKFFREP